MCRKLILLSLALVYLCAGVTAQQYAFQVSFTDKNNTPFSLSSPSAYLSARAIARRSNQGIPIDSSDLPVNRVYVDSVLRLTGGLLYETSKWLNFCVILLSDTDSTQILTLAGKSFISNVKQVGSYCANIYGRHTYSPGSTAAVSRTARTTGDAAYYGATWGQTQLVNGNYLHDQGYNGEGKLIAVLDAGFIGTDSHPWLDSMWADNRVVDTFNFTFHETNVFNQDDHGTQVLSTIAGYVPDSFVGAAPLASFALYVTENNVDDQPVEEDNMMAGAERADSIGADVITESLGYDLLSSVCSGQSYPESYDSMDGKTTNAAKAANFATKKGILFVATAGNDGNGWPGYGDYILTPGDADSALTIGAVDNLGNIANFSGYGPNAAGQVKPDVCALGAPAVVLNAIPQPYFTSGSGTSFSTPQIAGYAACLMQANPTANPYRIKQAIRECASSYATPGNQIGYGIANFECTQIVLDVKDTPPPFSAANWVIANPNPISGNTLHLSVQPDASQDVNFRLMDVEGRQVFSFGQYMYKGYNTPLSIDLPDLDAGIYLLHASSATQNQIIKLAKP